MKGATAQGTHQIRAKGGCKPPNINARNIRRIEKRNPRMIETIITCDHCAHQIKDKPAFTLTSQIVEINLRIDFRTHDCMKNYLMHKWSQQE